MATSAPQLTVFRLFDGTDRLTYRATMTDMRTYFVDADTGQVVWSTAAVVTQRAVGLGTGAVGDRKKISATLRHLGGPHRGARLGHGHAAPIDLGKDGIYRFERSRELQIGQHGPNVVTTIGGARHRTASL